MCRSIEAKKKISTEDKAASGLGAGLVFADGDMVWPFSGWVVLERAPDRVSPLSGFRIGSGKFLGAFSIMGSFTEYIPENERFEIGQPMGIACR